MPKNVKSKKLEKKMIILLILIITTQSVITACSKVEFKTIESKDLSLEYVDDLNVSIEPTETSFRFSQGNLEECSLRVSTIEDYKEHLFKLITSEDIPTIKFLDRIDNNEIEADFAMLEYLQEERSLNIHAKAKVLNCKERDYVVGVFCDSSSFEKKEKTVNRIIDSAHCI